MGQETGIVRKVLKKARHVGMTLFRANVGTGWTGNNIKRITVAQTITVAPGDVVIKNARPFSTGLPAGFPDTFGWAEIEITEDMVGKTLPVFAGPEVKTATGRQSPQQKNMERVIAEANGISGVVRSDGDLENMVARYRKKIFSE